MLVTLVTAPNTPNRESDKPVLAAEHTFRHAAHLFWQRTFPTVATSPAVVMRSVADWQALAVPGSRWLVVRGDITRSGGEYPQRKLCTVTRLEPRRVGVRLPVRGTRAARLRNGQAAPGQRPAQQSYWVPFGDPVPVPFVQQINEQGSSAPGQFLRPPGDDARFEGDSVFLLSSDQPGRVIGSMHYLGTVDRAAEQPPVSYADVTPVRVDDLRAGDVVYGPAGDFHPSRVGLTVSAVDLETVPATVHTHEGWPLSVDRRAQLATVRGPGWVTRAHVHTRPRLAPPAPLAGDWWHLDREVRRARWDAFVDRFGLGPARVDTAYGRVTPWSVSEFHPDPARRMAFFTGVGHPHRLNDSPVPLFLSVPTLARYRARGERFPVKLGQAPYAGDSGAYAALMLNKDREGHPWSLPAYEYGALWARLQDDVGPAEFIAIQDYPCEEPVRVRTGMTVRQHQELTLLSYLTLADLYPDLPWLPTLQGWHPWEYMEHVAMYERAGVDLRGRWVGVGSVCRRGSQTAIARVFEALAPLGMRLHGFGVSINGLRLVGNLMYSSDSQAWSSTARNERIRLPGCTHTTRDGSEHTDCRNCFRYAVHYREKVMDALRRGAAARAAVAAVGVQQALPLFELLTS
jgi:hypothetical protein